MLKHRVAVGLPLALYLIASFCLPAWIGGALFAVFAAFFITIGVGEFLAMTAKMEMPGHPRVAIFAALGFLLSSMIGSMYEELVFQLDALVMVACLLILFVGLLRETPSRQVACGWIVTLAGVVYAAWTCSFLAKLYFADGMSGKWLALYMVLVVKVSDVGAFFVGSSMARRAGGNHPMCPRLSPKKSWEGMAGGIAFSLITALLLQHYLASHLLYHGVAVVGVGDAVVFGVLCPIIGQLGDVAESALKRASGTKDSGRLPGLGGVLDILDSVIPVAPLFYVYIRLAVL